jgi:hypothetical protein
MAEGQPTGPGQLSGGPNEGSGRSEPFAVKQARRELKEAQDRLKAAKQGSADFKSAKAEVEKAQKQLEKLTKGSLADRRQASKKYMKDYFDKLGGDWVQALYEQFPELRSLLERAMAGGWDERRFRDEFRDSDFYKNPNRLASWFQAFELEYGSPKQFEQGRKATYDLIRAAADRYGVELTDAQLEQISRQFLYQGWSGNPNELDSFMARKFRKATDNYADPEFRVGGDVATNEATLRDLAKSMGIELEPAELRRLAARMTEARQNFSLTDAQQFILDAALQQYGDLSSLIGFVGEGGDFQSLRAAVARALDAGGETARKLFEDPRIQNLLNGWLGGDGRSLGELWRERLSDARTQIIAEARQLGLDLDTATLDRLSREYQYENWAMDPMGLKKALAALVQDPTDPTDPTDPGDPTDPTDPGDPGDPVWDSGRQAELERQLRSWARNYGVDLGNEWFTSWINKIILTPDSGFTDKDALNEIIKLSRQIYPVFSEEINDGVTVRDVAGGYIQRLARLLEIDASEVDLSDPLMQKALTGRGEDGKPNAMSLYDFAAIVRQDDRWQATDNALDSYAGVANSILRRMGFVG